RDCVVQTGTAQLTSSPYREAREYWLQRLRALPAAPELPLARNAAMLSRPTFTRREGHLPPKVWGALRARAAEAGLTPSAVLMAAFAQVLASWSKSPHFTLNVTLFNRPTLHPEWDQILGHFTTLTLLEANWGGRATFEQRAQDLQAQLWKDFGHR